MKPIARMILTSVLALSSLALPPLVQAEDKSLNFLHIIIDDLRSEGLSLYGDEDVIIAPNMERLAGEGVLFERAYANFPSCGASRASLFTGLRPTVDRFTSYDARLDKEAPGVITLPGYLKDNGYFTMSLGKVIHARGDTDHAWSAPPWDAKYQGGSSSTYMDFQNPDNVKAYKTSCKKRNVCSPTGSGKGPTYEIEDLPDQAYFDGKTAIAAIAALRELKSSGSPFYLAVGFVKPHLPFTPPKKYWDMYDRDEIQMSPAPGKPEGAPRQAWHGSGELREWYDGVPDTPPPWVQNVPDDLSRILRHGYYASTTYADAQVGKLLDAVESLGLEDNTVIILTSDHGWSLGDHTLWNKHSLFNLATQSPLIVRAPGMAADERVSGLVEYVDIYPTVLELAGLPKPGHLQGKSFAKSLRNPKAATKPAVFVRYKDGENIHTRRFSYTAWFNKGRLTGQMLYDLKKDPLETVNLADRPGYKNALSRLKAELMQHIDEREASVK
ncbi:MAG: sulfatase [Pseudomonadales bacterium]